MVMDYLTISSFAFLIIYKLLVNINIMSVSGVSTR